MGLKPGERHQLHEINPGLCKQVPKKHPWDKMAGYHCGERPLNSNQWKQPSEHIGGTG